MATSAKLNNVRISAQKARLVADQIRSMPIDAALELLEYSPKKAARLIKKLLNSAAANAEHNDGLDIDELYVREIYVNEGRTFKRFRARAKGRGNQILKRTCHITVTVSEKGSK